MYRRTPSRHCSVGATKTKQTSSSHLDVYWNGQYFLFLVVDVSISFSTRLIANAFFFLFFSFLTGYGHGRDLCLGALIES